jgi:hypothetical protein
MEIGSAPPAAGPAGGVAADMCGPASGVKDDGLRSAPTGCKYFPCHCRQGGPWGVLEAEPTWTKPDQAAHVTKIATTRDYENSTTGKIT